jgi:hypothetical protein
MRKDKLLQESKNYLIAAHDNLRRAFIHAPTEETVFINSVLDGIEVSVKQLEMLEELKKLWNTKEKNKIETIEE